MCTSALLLCIPSSLGQPDLRMLAFSCWTLFDLKGWNQFFFASYLSSSCIRQHLLTLPRATLALLTHKLALQSASTVDSLQPTNFWVCSRFLTPTQHRNNINIVHLNQQDIFGTVLATVQPKHKCFWKCQGCEFRVGKDENSPVIGATVVSVLYKHKLTFILTYWDS